MLKLNYFLADIFILSAEKQPIKLSWRKIEWLRDYVYFCAGKTSVSRISLKTWKVEENIIDLTKDAPNAKYLNCNAIADPIKKYLYVAVSDEYYETTISNGNLLVYDCSGETPVLVKNIENKTSYPVGIYPMSKFYK